MSSLPRANIIRGVSLLFFFTVHTWPFLVIPRILYYNNFIILLYKLLFVLLQCIQCYIMMIILLIILLYCSWTVFLEHYIILYYVYMIILLITNLICILIVSSLLNCVLIKFDINWNFKTFKVLTIWKKKTVFRRELQHCKIWLIINHIQTLYKKCNVYYKTERD